MALEASRDDLIPRITSVPAHASEALDIDLTWVFVNLAIQRVTRFIEPSNEASRRTAASGPRR